MLRLPHRAILPAEASLRAMPESPGPLAVKTASPARREPRPRRQQIADTATIVNPRHAG
jgi:hypothetical protein